MDGFGRRQSFDLIAQRMRTASALSRDVTDDAPFITQRGSDGSGPHALGPIQIRKIGAAQTHHARSETVDTTKAFAQAFAMVSAVSS